METIREQFSAAEVKNMSMEIDCAVLNVEVAEEQEISFTAEIEDAQTVCKSNMTDGRLVIRYESKHPKMHITEKVPRITVTLPKDFQCDEFRLELGAGSADMRNAIIAAERICMEVGAGSVKAGVLKAQTAVNVEVGAGEADFEKIETEIANLDCGVGQIRLGGKVEKIVNVKCGLGKCELNLEGNEADYNYEVSCGIGKVSVNGNRMGGIGGCHTQKSAQAAGKMNVNCGLGSVGITIA